MACSDLVDLAPDSAWKGSDVMAICSSCKGEVAAGMRWCGICHANVVNPEAGRLASPGKRLGAYFLDLIAPMVAFLLVIMAGGAASATGIGGGSGALLAAVLFLGYIVWAFTLFARGTTPGKNLLGMRVVKEDGTRATFFTMLAREWIGKLISALVLSLGFLWILLDRDNQGWHDKLVSTYVVH